MWGTTSGPCSLIYSMRVDEQSAMPQDDPTENIACQFFTLTLFVNSYNVLVFLLQWLSICNFLTSLLDDSQEHERWLVGIKLVALSVSWPRHRKNLWPHDCLIYMVTIAKDKNIAQSVWAVSLYVFIWLVCSNARFGGVFQQNEQRSEVTWVLLFSIGTS